MNIRNTILTIAAALALLILLLNKSAIKPKSVKSELKFYEKPNKVKEEQVKKAQPTKQPLVGALQNKSNELTNKSELPQLIADTNNAKAYFQWVLNNGGNVVFTRGGNHQVIGLATRTLSIIPPGDYQLPLGMARIVSSEANKVWGTNLPSGTTQVLMYWPQIKQKALEQQLLAMPFSTTAQSVKGTYSVKNNQLNVHLHKIKSSGTWFTINEVITL
ncbi:MAG: hypothetical protein ACI9YH_000146 [Colwellia sp.]|jgi:hypothetical protein